MERDSDVNVISNGKAKVMKAQEVVWGAIQGMDPAQLTQLEVSPKEVLSKGSARGSKRHERRKKNGRDPSKRAGMKAEERRKVPRILIDGGEGKDSIGTLRLFACHLHHVCQLAKRRVQP